MKKSFTLKAFALGVATAVALSASATPHQFLVKNANVASKTNAFMSSPTLMTEKPEIKQMTVKIANGNETAKATTATKQAPAKKAEANYGEWTTGGEGVYTYGIFGDYESYPSYDIRYDSANEGDFQMRTTYGKGIYSQDGAEAIITVTKNSDGTYTAMLPSEGVYIFEGSVTSELKADVFVYDYYHYALHLQAKGAASFEDEELATLKSYCTYDPETGTASFPCIATASFDNTDQYNGYYIWQYHWGTGGNNGVAYETYRRVGSEYKYYGIDLDTNGAYFNHAKDASTGTYNMNVAIYDNAFIAFRIVSGKKTETQAQTALQTMANEINTASDICIMQADGVAQIPVSNYKKGSYTLLYLFTDGIQDEDGNVGLSGYWDTSLKMTQDDVDYYDAGTATFTDATMNSALPYVFGFEEYEKLQETFANQLDVNLPDYYTVEVPRQANSKDSGSFRLVHPFATYYDNYLSTQLEYDPVVDYLVYNVADPNKAYVEPCATGIYYLTNSNSYIMMVYGSTNQMQGGAEASEDVWGTYSDGVLTFDKLEIPSGAETYNDCLGGLSWSQASYNYTQGEVTYAEWSELVLEPEKFKISGSATGGVQNVAADAQDLNAPVEYFNLQGIRVMNPEAGQLLIQRQGNKATKVVIR